MWEWWREFVTAPNNKSAERFKIGHSSVIYRLEYIDKMTDDKIKDNFDIFFRRKPALMLVALKRIARVRYGSVLAKEVDCTYSHAVKILQSLEKLGLVGFEKKGRIKLIKLTKRGQEVADNIENIKQMIN